MAGIYADEGISGTNTKKREEFKRMIADCEAHKIDVVITKSISRFARNTQDCLENYRKLKNLGVLVIFEKENISSADTTGELLLTILSSLAQDESRNISENSKWGIRSKFQEGIPHVNTHNFMGFDKDGEGRLVVNEKEAEVVRRIFREFLEGFSAGAIAAHLNEEKVPGVSGEAKWITATILSMLKNEKYKGDCLLQKYYTEDFLSKKQVRNYGEVTQYYVKESHDAIVSEEDWNAVQQELERIETYMAEHNLKHYGYGNETRPFSSKIICAKCGELYGRKSHIKRGVEPFWQCKTRFQQGLKGCRSENVKDTIIQRVFIEAWNNIVQRQGILNQHWTRLEKEGKELQRVRAKHFRGLAKQGIVTELVPELVQVTLESILVKGDGAFDVRFLDGTTVPIELDTA